MTQFESRIIAVDIGNSRIKFGSFAGGLSTAGLPQPEATVQVLTAAWDETALQPLFTPSSPGDCRWVIGSVNRPATACLQSWLAAQGVPADRTQLLGYQDLPLEIALPAPDKIGIDRLLAAVAANRLRAANQPAIAIDVGSAITIDVLDAAGVFRGGAILPGIGMGARALHTFTDLLPQLELDELSSPPPDPVGRDTLSAIHSGLFWGAVGAMRELVYRTRQTSSVEPLVLLTGGAAPVVADLLAGEPAPVSVQHEPFLILSGILLASRTNP